MDTQIQRTKGGADERDAAWLAQLRSFYGSRDGAPVWVTSKGWNGRAKAAIAEMANAADWGLDPAAFEIPQLRPDAPVDELASAELGLSRATLKYAFHARGGRIDPSS